MQKKAKGRRQNSDRYAVGIQNTDRFAVGAQRSDVGLQTSDF